MSEQPPEFYEFGPFRMEVTERRLLRGGLAVPLQPKVFNTLLALVENSGHLLKKADLMARLWPETFVEEATLARNISDLRKALGDGQGGKKYIETVSKQGYRFVARVEPAADAVGGRLAPSGEGTGAGAERTLAVLPFLSLGADERDEVLGAGLADALITRLSNLRQVSVRPTSAVIKYVGRRQDPLMLGRELGVAAVLEGSLQLSGGRLRVTVQMVSVKDEATLWAATFEEKFTDIFAVEDSISEQVVRALTLTLTGEERRRLGRHYTKNTDAYEAYLRGRYYWNRRTGEWVERGVECFQRAIDLDPNYAPAYAGLSDSYTLLVIREAMPPGAGFARAKAAAREALRIDDGLAEAHASLAHACLHNWEWQAAETEFERALERNPGYASAHHWHSEYLLARGRIEEAVAAVRRAKALDPLSLIINVHLADVLYYARRYDESVEQCCQALELDAAFFLARLDLGRAYAQKGLYEEGLAEMRRAREGMGGSREGEWLIGHTYALMGEAEKAREVLAQLLGLSAREYVSPCGIALIYAALGEADEAFAWLEEAYRVHDSELFTLAVEPKFDGLRTDPRFADLLRRMGLAPPSGQAGGRLEIQARPEDDTARTTVAVLPFKPIDAGQRDAYLELGIADALITRLSNISQIVVRPVSAVRKFTDLEQDPATAGRELRADVVLDGHIQKAGNRIRVTARLSRVEGEHSLWAGTFDEEFTGLFAVEDAISEKVTAALALRLTGEQRARLTRRYMDDVEAYLLYLKGRYSWNRRTLEGVRKGIDFFRQAITLDPNYAPAYAGLADCYTKLGDVGITVLPPEKAFSEAKQAAVRALEIDPLLAEAHTSLAHLHMHFYEWPDAERSFRRALELSPNYATAHHWYAYYLAFTRQFDEAIAELKRAAELDPLSLPINADFGEILYFTRRYDEAAEHLRKTLEMEPHFFQAHLNLARVYLQKGMYDEAVAEFLRARAISEQGTDALASLAHAYALSGRPGEAREILARLQAGAESQYVSPYRMALIHLGLGDRDRAFGWLRRAYAGHAEWMIYLTVDPSLDPLRADPRFARLVRRVGLAL